MDFEGMISNILGDELEAYTLKYKGNEAMLAKEALGKLLAKHLLQSSKIESSKYSSLLERLINVIKAFFKKFNTNDIKKAIYSADKTAGELATKLLAGEYKNDLSVKNIKIEGQLFDLGTRVQRDKTILKTMIDTTAKRIKIFEQRNPNSKLGAEERLKMDNLLLQLETNEELEGIYFFCEDAIANLKIINSDLSTLRKNSNMGANEKAAILRNARNFIYS